MLEVQPKDSRGHFMLPQAPEGAGYYVYGTPGNGASQYANPRLLNIILAVERQWQLFDARKFGIGNISLAGGDYTPGSQLSRERTRGGRASGKEGRTS